VILAAHGIGLLQPAYKLGIQVGFGGKSERMKVVPARERLHSPESGMVNTSSEDEVPVEPPFPRLGDGE
jgi:hypothetical protein